jgi:hypothetical protein
MTPDELKLGELAVLKRNLRVQLKEANEQLKVLAKTVDLPLIIVLNGEAVVVREPQYKGGVPMQTIARCVRPDLAH